MERANVHVWRKNTNVITDALTAAVFASSKSAIAENIRLNIGTKNSFFMQPRNKTRRSKSARQGRITSLR